MTIEYFYRFRQIENLLGKHEELEQQTIYFASPEQLNDPIEGFKDIYWEGDKVVWMNLFRNYLLCLTAASINFLLYDEKKSIESQISPSLTFEDLSDNYKEAFQEIDYVFFNYREIQQLILNIEKYRTKVCELELSIYFKNIHMIAIHCIFEQLIKLGFLSNNIIEKENLSILSSFNKTWFDNINRIEKENGGDNVQIHLQILSRVSSQNMLMVDYNHEHKSSNKKALLINFHSIYIKKLEHVMYPDWYTACFMTKSSNSSVWGNYANNHKGVCLMFSPDEHEGKLTIPLNNAVIGCNNQGVVKGTINPTFHPISYNTKIDPINFFNSIGQLPWGRAISNWFSTKDKEYSLLVPHDADEWRESYWKYFYNSITQKTKDWEYESEYRLIRHSMLNDISNQNQTLNYNFSSLKGIIFGINTSENDKHHIIKIILKKVRQNKHYDFKFYQSYYCRGTGEIKNYELNTLSFKNIKEAL